MYIPVPMLAVIAVAFLFLLAFAFRRRDGERDLIAPPRTVVPPASARFGPAAAEAGNARTANFLPPEIADEVRALSAAGRKIEAIKLVRESTGLGLAEAKQLVERM